MAQYDGPQTNQYQYSTSGWIFNCHCLYIIIYIYMQRELTMSWRPTQNFTTLFSSCVAKEDPGGIMAAALPRKATSREIFISYIQRRFVLVVWQVIMISISSVQFHIQTGAKSLENLASGVIDSGFPWVRHPNWWYKRWLMIYHDNPLVMAAGEWVTSTLSTYL